MSSAGRDGLLMHEAASLLAADITLSELFERLTSMLALYVDSNVVFVALARPNGRHAIEYFYDHGEIRRYPHIEVEEGSRTSTVIRTGEIIWGNHPSIWAPEGSKPIHRDRPWTNDTTSAIFVPMKAGGVTVGCLSVQSTRENAYTEREVDAIAAIGHYVGIAIQNQRMYQAVARTADFDPLTGIANQTRLTRELDEALAVATSTRPTVAILLNVVNFAMFNETYGHAEGDGVLRLIAQALREFEDRDEGVLVGRFGGDFFLVVLRSWSPDAIAPFLARLRTRLADLSYMEEGQILPISIACGCVCAPYDATDRQDVITLCAQRTSASRKRNFDVVMRDDLGAEPIYGALEGLEAIVEGLLDRDPYTRMHVLRVNALAKRWSEYNLELDARDLSHFLQCSALLDVGKMLVSSRLLLKPNRLTDEEHARIQGHADYGRDILGTHEGFGAVAEIVGQHHERWDGAGYPRGLSGEDIHPLARAIAVVDAFAAMTGDRPFHRAVTETAALAELERCAGAQFDPAFVERFVRWREEGRSA